MAWPGPASGAHSRILRRAGAPALWVQGFTALEQPSPLAGKPGLSRLTQWPASLINFLEPLHEQVAHVPGPGIPDFFTLLFMHVHQLPEVVGIAQAVRACQAFVADQPVMDECALDAPQQPQRFKSDTAPLGVKRQPGQRRRDGAVQPMQLAFDADAGLRTTGAACTAWPMAATVACREHAAS